MRNYLFIVCLLLLTTSCYRMRMSNGGGQVKSVSQRNINPQDILLPPGYKIELIADGLTFPTAIAVDDKNDLFVVEAGYAYGEVWREPKLIALKTGSVKEDVVVGEKNGPWTGLQYHNGQFYISEGGEANGGKILRVSPSGNVTTLAEGLPSMGDHHTNSLVIKDGYIYFGQGTATNSAVVGPDNAEFGWLKRNKEFHDVPCGDLVLTGENYESDNVLSENSSEKVFTGAFSPFGTPTKSGQIVKGNVPCTGAILRIPLDGGTVEMVSWGLRNPFGIAVSPDGKLYTTENAYDDRGTRPVWGAGDVLWEVKDQTWYGWPDFSEGKPVQDDEEFKAPSKKKVKPLIKSLPNTPPQPAAVFGVHSSSSGLDFSISEQFGFKGEAFVAQFGDMAPNVGKVLKPVGFKIVRVNVGNGIVRDFAVNKGKTNGPASWLKSGGLERPVSVRFDPGGEALYVVDFGILRMTKEGPAPQEGTGVIWKISKK